jgi:hypothetical protein
MKLILKKTSNRKYASNNPTYGKGLITIMKILLNIKDKLDIINIFERM